MKYLYLHFLLVMIMVGQSLCAKFMWDSLVMDRCDNFVLFVGAWLLGGWGAIALIENGADH